MLHPCSRKLHASDGVADGIIASFPCCLVQSASLGKGYEMDSSESKPLPPFRECPIICGQRQTTMPGKELETIPGIPSKKSWDTTGKEEMLTALRRTAPVKTGQLSRPLKTALFNKGQQSSVIRRLLATASMVTTTIIQIAWIIRQNTVYGSPNRGMSKHYKRKKENET